MPVPLMLALVIAAVIGVPFYIWQHGQAREVVEGWARRHSYRLRHCEWRPFAVVPYVWPPSEHRVLGWRHAGPVFRVVVDDLELGGTRTADVRCWIKPFGGVDEDVDVLWVTQLSTSVDPSAVVGPRRWQNAQLALLYRVADGETAFRSPDQQSPEASAAFDELVEHLLALRRRGLLSFADPIPNRQAAHGRYASVTDIALTDDARRIVARRQSATPS